MQLQATTEGVIVLIDKDSGEPVAIIRKNGSVQWFGLKEMSWSDFEELFDVTAIQNG